MSLTVKGFILLIWLWESLEEVFYHQIWGGGAVYCELHFPVSLTPLFILTLLMLCDR